MKIQRYISSGGKVTKPTGRVIQTPTQRPPGDVGSITQGLSSALIDISAKIDQARKASQLSGLKIKTIRKFADLEKEYNNRADYEKFGDRETKIAKFREEVQKEIRDPDVANAYMPYLENYATNFDLKIDTLARNKFIEADNTALGNEIDNLVNVAAEFPDYDKIIKELRPNGIAAIAGREASGVIGSPLADKHADMLDDRLWDAYMKAQAKSHPIELEKSLDNFELYPGLSAEKRAYWQEKIKPISSLKQVQNTFSDLVQKHGTDFEAMEQDVSEMADLDMAASAKVRSALKTAKANQKEREWDAFYSALEVGDEKTAKEILKASKNISQKEKFNAKKTIKTGMLDDDNNAFFRAYNRGDYNGAAKIAARSTVFDEKDRGEKIKKAEAGAINQRAIQLMDKHGGDFNAASKELDEQKILTREQAYKVGEIIDNHRAAYKKKVDAYREEGKKTELEKINQSINELNYADADQFLEEAEHLTAEEFGSIKTKIANARENRLWQTRPELEDSLNKKINSVTTEDSQKLLNEIEFYRGMGLSNATADKLVKRVDTLINDPVKKKRYKEVASYAEARWKSLFPKEKSADRYFQYEQFANYIADEIEAIEKDSNKKLTHQEMIKHVDTYFEQKVKERSLFGVDYLLPDKKYFEAESLFNGDPVELMVSNQPENKMAEKNKKSEVIEEASKEQEINLNDIPLDKQEKIKKILEANQKDLTPENIRTLYDRNKDKI